MEVHILLLKNDIGNEFGISVELQVSIKIYMKAYKATILISEAIVHTLC